MRELLVREAHGGKLMEHLGVAKTLNVLHEHFYWPKMKKNVKRTCNWCITCKQVKSKVLPYSIYTHLLISKKSWVDISMNFVLGLPKKKKRVGILFL